MDITGELLNGASPFLSKLTYDVIKRELLLVAVDGPDEMNDIKKIVFPDITHYSEEVEEIDDELIEGVIGIHRVRENQICVKIDTREIVVTLNGKAYVQSAT